MLFRSSPQMGFEGANVIFDTWVHPLVMGLEEHLLTMFRDDFEFSDEAGPSHLHGAARRHEGESAPAPSAPRAIEVAAAQVSHGDLAEARPAGSQISWTAEAEQELRKVPFFVRGKVRRNTEAFAVSQGRGAVDLATLYDAKAHYAR